MKLQLQSGQLVKRYKRFLADVKLTDDVTVIYINDEVPSVKLKYKHGRHTESVIGVSEESQSYDIIYKRDYEELGF